MVRDRLGSPKPIDRSGISYGPGTHNLGTIDTPNSALTMLAIASRLCNSITSFTVIFFDCNHDSIIVPTTASRLNRIYGFVFRISAASVWVFFVDVISSSNSVAKGSNTMSLGGKLVCDKMAASKVFLDSSTINVLVRFGNILIRKFG